jgi:phospholipase/lecithinase/hemolysin
LGADPDTITAALEANGVSNTEAAVIVDLLEASQHTTGYLKLVDGGGNGTDFAIGGAVTGITDFNSNAAIAITDLAAQVTNFENEITPPVTNALYTVWAGANDVLNLVESSDIATLVSSGAATVDIAQSASAEVAAVSSLVTNGAENLLVVNVPDIGTVPDIVARGSADVAFGTQLAQDFNIDLTADLAAADFGTASVKLVDAFSLIDDAEANPAKYGLNPLTIKDSVYTGSFTNFTTADLVSSDPAVQNTYLFFDGQHPTSTGQEAVANLADAALPCFAAGTRLLTPAGEVAVEALREGEPVLSAFGGSVPVQWLGHRRIDCRRHPRPWDVWPVRVRAGAFGANLPHRDLLLSPDHAVFVAAEGDGEGAAPGVLMPIRYLINGATIVQEPADAVTYWHVELPSHDVLLAEGLPAESYLDTGNRSAFANGGGAVAAHPDFSRQVWQAKGRAPLVLDGPVLARQQALLLERAEALGYARTAEADLCVIAGEHTLRPRRDGATLVWDLPPGTSEITLRSRSAVPAWTEPGRTDHRRLGVAVWQIRLDGRELPPSVRGEGWHAAEAGFQWTDGEASLAAGPGRFEVTLAMSETYWRDAEPHGERREAHAM